MFNSMNSHALGMLVRSLGGPWHYALVGVSRHDLGVMLVESWRDPVIDPGIMLAGSWHNPRSCRQGAWRFMGLTLASCQEGLGMNLGSCQRVPGFSRL